MIRNHFKCNGFTYFPHWNICLFPADMYYWSYWGISRFEIRLSCCIISLRLFAKFWSLYWCKSHHSIWNELHFLLSISGDQSAQYCFGLLLCSLRSLCDNKRLWYWLLDMKNESIIALFHSGIFDCDACDYNVTYRWSLADILYPMSLSQKRLLSLVVVLQTALCIFLWPSEFVGGEKRGDPKRNNSIYTKL